MAAKYDVFISYSRKDYVDNHDNVLKGNEVSKIKEALKKAGISFWFDEDGIYSGQDFVTQLVSNIQDSKIFIFLSSANSNQSHYTCKEIACADEFKKYIIPVRLDATPYNQKVLFRIADLNYINYYVNPQKGIEDLITSIQKHLREMASNHRKTESDEFLINEISTAVTELNIEEARLELQREELLSNAKNVVDTNQRNLLVDLIKKGGVIHQKYQLKCSELSSEIDTLKKSKPAYNNKKNRKLHIIYWFAILWLGGLLYGAYEKYEYMDYEIDRLSRDEEIANERLDNYYSQFSPIIIEDILICNEGDKWGDKIYSEKSTYIYIGIKYIGFERGDCRFNVKFYDNEGKLSYNNSISPRGYTTSKIFEYSEGNKDNYLCAWGGKSPGYWSSGNYRVELWYNNRMLATKEFTVY